MKWFFEKITEFYAATNGWYVILFSVWFVFICLFSIYLMLQFIYFWDGWEEYKKVRKLKNKKFFEHYKWKKRESLKYKYYIKLCEYISLCRTYCVLKWMNANARKGLDIEGKLRYKLGSHLEILYIHKKIAKRIETKHFRVAITQKFLEDLTKINLDLARKMWAIGYKRRLRLYQIIERKSMLEEKREKRRDKLMNKYMKWKR